MAFTGQENETMKIQGSCARPASLRFDGSRLFMLRKKNGLNLEMLALRSGMSCSVVQRLEVGGIRNPSINTVIRVSRALECKCEDLCSKHGEVGV